MSHSSRAPYLMCLALVGLFLSPNLFAAGEPQFTTWKDDPSFHRPNYPLVFVASYRHTGINNGGNFGTHVLEAGAPSHGQTLWMLLPDGTTEKLFPNPGVHDTLVDVTPIGAAPVGGSLASPEPKPIAQELDAAPRRVSR